MKINIKGNKKKKMIQMKQKMKEQKEKLQKQKIDLEVKLRKVQNKKCRNNSFII